MRLWLGEQALRLWPADMDLRLWTPIPIAEAVSAGQLHTLSPVRLTDALRQQLARSGIEGPIMGGVDGEYDRGRGVWQPHFHLIVPNSLRPQLTNLARRFYPNAPRVYRASHSEPIADRAKAFSYVYKSYWVGKNRRQTPEDKPKRKGPRLEEARHLEWLLWCDQYQLTDFLFLRGVRRHGCRLKLTASLPDRLRDDVTT
jgi:hypothetical protein